MTQGILNFQLKRAHFIALLEEEKLKEAIKAHKEYINSLKTIIPFKKLKKEIEVSNEIFCTKLETLGEKYDKEKQSENALLCYENIYLINPSNAKNLKNYIALLEKLKQNDLAVLLAKKLVIVEDNPENYKILSRVLAANTDYLEAIKMHEKALELAGVRKWSDYDVTAIACHYYNLYVNKKGKYEYIEKAFELYKTARKMKPESKIYLKNLVAASIRVKNWKIEQACWKELIKRNLMDDEDRFTYSASLLRNGEIEEYTKYYEYRFKRKMFEYYTTFNRPLWDGRKIPDKTLFIYFEQGFGDTMLMFGYAKRLKQYAKKVVWAVQKELVELLKNSLTEDDKNIEIVATKDIDPFKYQYDYYITTMSIPYALKLNKNNISVNGGYLKARADKIKKYKNEFFNTDKLKVGFAFLGKENIKRDIPFDKILMLDKLKNVQLYCFTKDIPDSDINKFKRNKVINIARDFQDFSDTAAALENVDIVISSDNCILNLAGALGKKTIGIFNHYYEFRWYDLSGNDVGWYKSVKPIINNCYDDWGLSIKKAMEEIELFRKTIKK